MKSTEHFFDIQTYTGDNTTKVVPHRLGSITGRHEWVGLTDDDVQAIIDSAMREITNGDNTFKLSANGVWSALVRAIEAKLKLKNFEEKT
jgi:hypothetical protein